MLTATKSPRTRVTVIITTGLSNDRNGASDSGLMDEWRSAIARQCDKGCNPHHDYTRRVRYTNVAASH